MLGLGLAAGIFLGRLSTGPVALDWLKPRIEEALEPGNNDLRVTIGETALRLNEGRRTVELMGLDVTYTTEEGRPVLSFPEVKVTLSVEAFLKHGLVAASNVEATAPSLRLTRNQQGHIGLHSAEIGEEASLEDMDFADFFRHFVLAPPSDERIGYLKRLKISGGRVTFDDRTRKEVLTAEAADLVLIRQEQGVSGWLKGDLVQENGRASLQLLGRVDETTERVHLVLDASNLVAIDLLRPWRSALPRLPAEMDRIDAPLEALIKGSIDLDGTLSPIELDLGVSDYLLDLPAHLDQPVPLTEVSLKGVLSPDLDKLDIGEARLQSLDAELGASGEVTWRDDALGLALDLRAANVRAETLPALWPRELGPEARSWVLENIGTGRVPLAGARLELQQDDFGPEPLGEDALRGFFTFEDLSLRYIDTMPPLEQGRGKATFDASRMDFEVDSAKNAGVDISGGTVSITGLGLPGQYDTQMSVQVEAEGPVDRALALLDHPPLEVARELEIPPDLTSGRFSTNIEIDMPLYDEVTDDEVDVAAEADLVDLGIATLPRFGDDAELENGQLNLSIGNARAILSGTADVAGLPLTINIEEPLVESDTKRRILLGGRVDRDQLAGIGIEKPGLEGTLSFEATVTETDDNLWIDLDGDLTDLALAPAGITWQKPRGDKGRLRASIALPNDGPIDVKHLELTANDLKATGQLTLSRLDYSLDMLTLTDIRLGDNQGSLRLQHANKAAKEVIIEVAALDLDSLLASDKKKSFDLDLGRLNLAIRADRLTYQGVDMLDLQADLAHGKDGWRTASLLATLASGNRIALELVPEGDGQRLDIRSDDAGAFIRTLGLGGRIDRGYLHLAATLSSQEPLSAEGRLEIKDFTIADAPLLARLLTVASLQGIGNLLEGEGIQVDELQLPFTVRDQTLTLSNGLLRGSQLGLTTKGALDLERKNVDLQGTIIPVYTLNRLIGQVPIIGRILTGAEGLGAFAATYRISGPQAQPEVYVNPLSILTPGLIRDFFGGLIDGTLSPPELRETDD